MGKLPTLLHRQFMPQFIFVDVVCSSQGQTSVRFSWRCVMILHQEWNICHQMDLFTGWVCCCQINWVNGIHTLYVMLSKIQWKPFWLLLALSTEWLGWIAISCELWPSNAHRPCPIAQYQPTLLKIPFSAVDAFCRECRGGFSLCTCTQSGVFMLTVHGACVCTMWLCQCKCCQIHWLV